MKVRKERQVCESEMKWHNNDKNGNIENFIFPIQRKLPLSRVEKFANFATTSRKDKEKNIWFVSTPNRITDLKGIEET